MNIFANMNLARNEIENYIYTIQKSLELPEDALIFVLEGVLDTTRHKAIVRNTYSLAQKEVKESTNNEKEEITSDETE